jgi:ribosomal-protein-alanine N-acetyltransferase
MSEADLPRIHRIELASYAYPWSLGNFADSLQAGYSMWVREAEGEVIGYYAMMAAAGEAHLLNLTIAPIWRRHGLGRDMLDLLRACDPAESLFPRCAPPTPRIALYRAAVSRPGGAAGPPRDGREDALIMKKVLSC